MFLRIGYEMSFEIAAPTAMVLMLYVHPERAGDLREPERLKIEPQVRVEDFLDCFGNRCARVLAPAGVLKISSDNFIGDSGQLERNMPIESGTPNQIPVHELPTETLQFPMASR